MKIFRTQLLRKLFLVSLLSLAAFVVSILAKNIKKEDGISGSPAYITDTDILPVAHAEEVSCASVVGCAASGSDACSSAAACGSGCGSGSGGCSGV